MSPVVQRSPTSPNVRRERRKTAQITLRLASPELEDWLDARVAAVQAKYPGRRITLSDLVRDILWDAMRAECHRRSPRVPFPTESPVPGSHDGPTGEVRLAARVL